MKALLLLTSHQRIYSSTVVVALSTTTRTPTFTRNQIRHRRRQHFSSCSSTPGPATLPRRTTTFRHHVGGSSGSSVLRISSAKLIRTTTTALQQQQQQQSWSDGYDDDDCDKSRSSTLIASDYNYNATTSSSYSSYLSRRTFITTSVIQSTIVTTSTLFSSSPACGYDSNSQQRFISTTTPASTKGSSTTDDSKSTTSIGSSSSSIKFPNEDSINAMFTLPKVPDRIPLRPNQRLVAIGDVHGDYNQLCNVLRIANLVDENLNWIGNKNEGVGSGEGVPGTICVQCGDVVDRGPYELKCLKLLTKLSQQAAAKQDGSMLTLLYGNHETLWMEGDFRYAEQSSSSSSGDFISTAQEEFERYFGGPLDKSKFGSKPSSETNNNDDWRKLYMNNDPSRWVAYEPCGYLSKPLLGNMKVAIIVGKSLLVHAGLTKQHLDEYSVTVDDDENDVKGKGDGISSLETMNRVANEWLVNPPYRYDGIMNMMNRLLQAKQKDKTITNDVYEEYIKQIAHYRAYVIAQSIPSCLGGGMNGNESPVWMRLYSSPSDKPPSNPILAQETIGTLY